MSTNRLLFWTSPSSLVLIQSCNRLAIRANVNKPSDATRMSAARSRHSIYPRYTHPTDNARQTNRQYKSNFKEKKKVH